MTSRLLIALLFVFDTCSTPYLTGKAVRVADGDTFTLLSGTEQQRIRLYGIDCPERGQPFGRVATEFTRELLASGRIEVKEMDVDQYGRIVGIVFIADTINLNERLLQAGLAWHYKAYDSNPFWAAMELDARATKRGLWAAPDAIAPWRWRRK